MTVNGFARNRLCVYHLMNMFTNKTNIKLPDGLFYINIDSSKITLQFCCTMHPFFFLFRFIYFVDVFIFLFCFCSFSCHQSSRSWYSFKHASTVDGRETHHRKHELLPQSLHNIFQTHRSLVHSANLYQFWQYCSRLRSFQQSSFGCVPLVING